MATTRMMIIIVIIILPIIFIFGMIMIRINYICIELQYISLITGILKFTVCCYFRD